MASFVTVNDFSVRLGLGTLEAGSAKYNQVKALLEDASDDLRSQVGQPIDPGDIEWTTRVPAGAHITLPVLPIVSIESVLDTDSGAAIEYTQEDAQTIRVAAPMNTRVTITYSYGWQVVPSELKKWTRVIAAAMLAAAGAGNLGLSGGIAGVAVDDGRITFATRDGEQGSGIEIPETALAAIRSRYGFPSTVLEMRP